MPVNTDQDDTSVTECCYAAIQYKIVDQEEVAITDNVDVGAFLRCIEGEIGELCKAMGKYGKNELKWRELFSASSALQWVLNMNVVAQPHVAIAHRDAARSHYLAAIGNF